METKICSNCSIEKTIDLFENRKESADGKNNQCKLCKAYKAKIYREKNKEKIKILNIEWRIKNPEKTKNIYKSYKNKNKEKIKIKRYEFNNKSISNLSNNYVIKNLIQRGLSIEQIKENKELIEVQRLIIKTKRLCKTLQN
jgi:hypothetical protein